MTTSAQALKTARGSGITAVQQRTILKAIAATVWTTRWGLAQTTPYNINVICPRVLELIKRGMIKEIGKTKTKYPSRLLAVTDKGQAWLSQEVVR